jgi:hypothetical protein
MEKLAGQDLVFIGCKQKYLCDVVKPLSQCGQVMAILGHNAIADEYVVRVEAFPPTCSPAMLAGSSQGLL